MPGCDGQAPGWLVATFTDASVRWTGLVSSPHQNHDIKHAAKPCCVPFRRGSWCGRRALWPPGTVDESNKEFEQRLIDYAPQAWRSCRRNGCGVWCGRRSRRPPQSAPRASTSGSLRRVYAVENSPDAVQIWHCLCAAPYSETVNPKTSRTPPFSTTDDTMVCPACECWRSRTLWFGHAEGTLHEARCL